MTATSAGLPSVKMLACVGSCPPCPSGPAPRISNSLSII